MQTRTYIDLVVLIESLFGSKFAATELGRVRALINRRATSAYNATDYWPRFLLVGEERAVSSSIVPFEEAALPTVGTFLKIHSAKPYQASQSQQFDFFVTAAGANLIAGTLAPTSVFVTYKADHSAIYGTIGNDVQNVPKEWFEYIGHGAYADALRMEGQNEKAAIADAEAREILADELMRADEQTPSFIKTSISTNSTRQNR